MKILFLDIDGVLNSERTRIAYGGFPHEITGPCLAMFDDVALRLIRQIVKAAGAQVVLSSSWRIHHHFAEVGAVLDLPIIDKTPSLMHGRGTEIQHWLDAHPEVEAFAIVDDSADMLDRHMPYFVHTNLFDGFMWKDAQKMAELLGIKVYDAFPGNPRRAEVKLAWE